MAMADMEGTYHFDGDGCVVYSRGHWLDTKDGWVMAEDLPENATWRDPAQDTGDTWWYADEVVVMGGDGDEVHVEYSSAARA